MRINSINSSILARAKSADQAQVTFIAVLGGILVGGTLFGIWHMYVHIEAYTTGMRGGPGGLVFGFFLAFFAGIYLLPFGLAAFRGHPRVWAIAIANALIGWTIVGWLLLLGVALSRRSLQADKSEADLDRAYERVAGVKLPARRVSPLMSRDGEELGPEDINLLAEEQRRHSVYLRATVSGCAATAFAVYLARALAFRGPFSELSCDIAMSFGAGLATAAVVVILALPYALASQRLHNQVGAIGLFSLVSLSFPSGLLLAATHVEALDSEFITIAIALTGSLAWCALFVWALIGPTEKPALDVLKQRPVGPKRLRFNGKPRAR